ncbi:MAG: tetratricopeptide repeat protein [Pseudomonadota bacterium]
MSLLMDALKKAEEEKKQAAKRLQEVEIETREHSGENEIINEKNVVAEEDKSPLESINNTSELSLEPLSVSEQVEETKEEEPVDDSEDQWEIETVDASEVFSEDLTLESTIAESNTPEVNFEETQKEIDLNDTTIIEGLSTESASAPFDDTFHGVVFEEEESDTEFYDETLPGVPAEQLVKDLGGGKYQPTPVAAQTVFAVSGQHKKQSSFKWGAFAVLGILAAGSFAIFYYFTITPVSRDLPSPLIARGIESSGVDPVVPIPDSVLEQTNETVVTNELSNITIDEQTKVETFEAVELESQPTMEEISVQENIVEQVDPQIVVTTETIKPTDVTESAEYRMEKSTKVESDNNKVISEESNLASTNKFENIVDEEINTMAPNTSTINPIAMKADPALINISKSKKVKEENAIVSQAYNAYQAGLIDAASSLYQDVLKSDPDNRNAHLGLGAIAIKNQNRKDAYSHYVHLLELNPLDTLAMNALIGLSNSADPVKDESAIKLLLQREGDVPYLYFSLGNLYAKQNRWVNAQQAFFDAYRLDTTNPDYVLNLAISLDQMGQYDTALDYYKSAIELSENSAKSFDPFPVNNRILALSKLIESTP